MVEKGKKDVKLGTPENTGTTAEESSWADKKVTRRTVLKGAAAAAAGLAAGPVITGAPTIWAQKSKDQVLHHVGAPYSAIIDIAPTALNLFGLETPKHMDGCNLIDMMNTPSKKEKKGKKNA